MAGSPDRRGEHRLGCYPGSFNPPTVAHLAVAEAALVAGDLDRVDLVVSRSALGKAAVAVPTLSDRVDVLRQVAATRPWLQVVVSDHRLVADLAAGYDAVVMGADKWRQVKDPSWYGGGRVARDAAVAGLPLVLVAPRADDDVAEPADVVVLRLPADHRPVNASAVRSGEAGARSWMLPEAAAFDARTHAWTDPARYRPDLPVEPG